MQPDIDVDYVHPSVSLDMLQGKVPNYDDRRAIISRDALASVDGFRVTTSCLLCNDDPQ